MKKRVAVFGNGWSTEYLQLVLEGMKKRAGGSKVDLYVFINYSAGAESKMDNIGEKRIFELPDISIFDGAILLGNTFNLNSEREYLQKEILKYKIPAVSLEYKAQGIPCLYTDTYSGMYKMTKHLMEKHGVRNVIYVSGPADNSENIDRRRAVTDALLEAGLRLEEEQVVYGQWSYYDSYVEVSKWLEHHNTLPDAFICANDEMAIGTCAALDLVGKKVPEHVLVTGCDCGGRGQKMYPILSTVAREWDKLGYDGLDYVLRLMNGEKLPENIEYKSYPVYGESGGCKVSEERREKRRHSILETHMHQRASNMYEWHLRYIDDMMAKITEVGILKDQLGWNFAYNHSYEGENFLMCLVEGFFEDTRSIQEREKKEYTDTMDVFVHLENGKDQPRVSFPRRELLPPMNLSEESHCYAFVPLHLEEISIGYAVFIDEMGNLYNETMYTWARHVSQNLVKVHQSIRLEELNKRLMDASMTDALTGLKNRTGYDALAFPYLQRCQKEGKISSMIFADINRMKRINDIYGHIQGDIAIRTVADAIKMTMPAEWIAVRFGGDEFIMVGECRDHEEAEELKNLLAANLEQLKAERNLGFPLSVSFGAVVITPGEDYNLEEYLRKADEAMYVMKGKAHAEEG